MKRAAFNVVTIILAIVYIGLLIVGNVFYRSIPIATAPGSYAERFAQENMLHQINVPDSEKKFLDFRYENFDYNTTDKGTISIESYAGKSEDLMIPAFIGETMVTTIGEHFFDNLDIESLYLPETIVEIKAEPTKKVILYCDKDAPFYKRNQDSEDWKLETTYDSTYYNPFCADIPFYYNDNGKSIELVGYKGDDKIIAIPSYIDGKPVTTVSFNLLGHYDMVIFPDTVTEINGKVSTWIFSPVLVIELIFTVLAFVIVIATVNVILPRYARNLNEYMLSGPQVIFSILYLAAQIYLCFRYIYLVPISPFWAILISLALLLAYILIISLLNRGRKQSYKVMEEVRTQTESVRNLQSMVKNLSDGISDPETKKAVSRVMDEIRFTQAKSKDTEVENLVAEKITLLKGIIAEGNKDEIIAKCEDIISLMKNR
ncbi:MAG: hypothetical protein J5518_01675 [Lachnospiraceae bacterium]|nr:hypothetical protein [Lachnospiraceae bacterium]